MYEDLIHNTALLVALTTLYTLLWRVTGPRPALGKMLSGLLFGVVAVVGMQLPFHYAPGVIYDGRSIILSMAGLFGGGTAAVVSSLLAGAYRAQLGGSGVWAGLGTIVGCAGVGVVFRRIHGDRPERIGAFSLYGFGIGAHVVMLGCQLLIQPWPAGVAVIERIWLPILLIFPPATVLTGLLIGNEQRRLRAERRLKESETLLSRSQSVGHVGSWELDRVRDRLTWSDQVYRLFGFDPHTFTPSYDEFLKGVHPDDRAAVDAAYRRSVQEGRDGYQIEHRILRREDGQIRSVYQKCEHFREASGRITRSVGIIQDLTDIKQAQEEISQLFAMSIDMICIMDIRTATLVKVNPAFTATLGYPAEELLEKSILTFIHPDDSDETRAVIEEKLLGRMKAVPFENRCRCQDGRYRWVSWVFYPGPQRGRTYAIGRDITERKQAEERILSLNKALETRVAQRTAELLEANKDIEDFVYSVSHDLRAPLRSISGFAEIIHRRHTASLNEEGRHYFDNIVKASRQMGDLIDDLLNFSRLGRKSIKIEPVALEDVLRISLKTLGDQIAESNARVVLPDRMPVIQGDATLLTHIFINLLENAIKYRKPDVPPRIDIGVEEADRSIVVSISDNGIGIEPEHHEKIFKMFQRLHSQVDYPGTGIGLAAARKAVQMIGGEVWVESEPGVGSVFRVRISKSEAAGREAAK